MKTAPTSLKVHQIVRDYEQNTLMPRPYFQRRYVWTTRDKHNFIDTILKSYPFPEIYLADGSVNVDTGEGKVLLVDGQQRVTAIIEYFRGALKNVKDSDLVMYKDLTKDQKEAFLQYDVAVRALGNLKDFELVEVFKRINMTNYSLNEMEINNAVYSGEFKKFCETVADDPFFEDHKIFRPMQKRRMGDVKYVSALVATLLGGYFNRDDRLEEYLERYNEYFDKSEEIKVRLEKSFEAIEQMLLPPESRGWKQADLFTLIVETDRVLQMPNRLLKRLDAGIYLGKFYDIVDGGSLPEDDPELAQMIQNYYKATQQAVNDRASRLRRAEPIQIVLNNAADDLPEPEVEKE